MLFNSYVFVFLFLPLVLAGYCILARSGRAQVTYAWLTLCSLFYYAWWDARHLLLMLASLLFNYTAGRLLATDFSPGVRKTILVFGIVANLATLCYFKYALFLADSVSALFDWNVRLPPIVLPLAISFFTFQQVAYLVDAFRGKTGHHGVIEYCLFVSFFPQLIAGPIVHHDEILPQLARRAASRLRFSDLSIGSTIFVIGLFKKVIVADELALLATPLFDAAAGGHSPALGEAWLGTLAYSLQLYFDFSGYSDMAIGLSRLFGIRLPVNFDSPYRAVSIIDFWRRWHITLSRFLRDYLYIPLGGSRHGEPRRCVNLMITMLLGGLWHGAGWTFVAWGALHGVYLCINHAWNRLTGAADSPQTPTLLRIALSRGLTFLAVAVAWVFFRAESFPAAGRILHGMAGGNGTALPVEPAALLSVGVGLAAVWCVPNTQQIMRRFRPALGVERHGPLGAPAWLLWRPSNAWALGTGCLWIVCILRMSRVQEFIYYHF